MTQTPEIPYYSKQPEEGDDADEGADDEDVEGDRGEADEEARGQVDRRVEQHRGAQVEPQVRHRHRHRGGHRARHCRRRRRGRLCSLGGHTWASPLLLDLRKIDEFLGALLPCYAYQVFKGGDGSISNSGTE